MDTRPGGRRRRTAIVAAPIHTPRLTLEPLRLDHATEMAEVLGDPALYRYLGGRPPQEEELRSRYADMLEGSDEPGVRWCNWIVREDSGQAVGTVQATVGPDIGGLRAVIAWMVGTPWQRRGYAAEASRGMVEWLHARGVRKVNAHIDPHNEASAAVARGIGLIPTDADYHGETVWTGRPRF
ncbi:GNAT family N-acetyltransferase [Nocardiopsis ansamitocini]|uniref:Acetyltransferase n=1 Tax=Nocardiopsis ansamitocini TaxID=1670832 RepID=A0A9W6P771_9ACTN|nr:GNAT family N-acetyltransferase [Nocardiopsis ansamitocini]GLU48435.1 acetyltransferase [Nocardiopsis ansamitocini]